MVSNFCINFVLVMVICMVRLVGSNVGGLLKVYIYRDNDSRFDKCFMISWVVKIGKVNVCSGKIFVIIVFDYFGFIIVEYDFI